MDRKQAKEMLPILVAFTEGKTIQSRCVKGDTSLWYDDEDPSFDGDFEYRIKPEPKFRPFANAEECWAEMLKHQPFGWVNVLGINQKMNLKVIRDVCDFEAHFKEFTFADGTPFGVKVEE